ncbi:DUF1150 family protein [Yoonia sediminilitoris]|uniref:Uncharacterized protein DUF1150 n=1 Tax=Yoonia sediminilitoris TaxID=1286148 RepID=A0A2T6KPM6_9RHOB|nr:DUF1150 family protein [Yoonia sediminilitoris]PUB18523.1 uncharacterized protein DUF1150 [Yoonia sediminilitoris]RCW98691.1 uncharacterized protein DUF1150 [Yoonia sediminilitoris]
MNTKFDLATMGRDIVYVKPVPVTDLPKDMRVHAGGLETIFAVHNTQGEQLALVANKRLAFDLARENDMQPVTVH